MSRRVLKLRLLLLPLALGASACADAPEGQTSRYALVRTQAGELPALLGEKDGCRYLAVGGEVVLKPESEYEALLMRRRECAPPAFGDTLALTDTTFADRGEGTYRVEGDSVFFRFPTGASAGYGVMSGDTLTVRGTGQTLIYRRESR